MNPGEWDADIHCGPGSWVVRVAVPDSGATLHEPCPNANCRPRFLFLPLVTPGVRGDESSRSAGYAVRWAGSVRKVDLLQVLHGAGVSCKSMARFASNDHVLHTFIGLAIAHCDALRREKCLLQNGATNCLRTEQLCLTVQGEEPMRVAGFMIEAKQMLAVAIGIRVSFKEGSRPTDASVGTTVTRGDSNGLFQLPVTISQNKAVYYVGVKVSSAPVQMCLGENSLVYSQPSAPFPRSFPVQLSPRPC